MECTCTWALVQKLGLSTKDTRGMLCTWALVQKLGLSTKRHKENAMYVSPCTKTRSQCKKIQVEVLCTRALVRKRGLNTKRLGGNKLRGKKISDIELKLRTHHKDRTWNWEEINLHTKPSYLNKDSDSKNINQRIVHLQICQIVRSQKKARTYLRVAIDFGFVPLVCSV